MKLSNKVQSTFFNLEDMVEVNGDVCMVTSILDEGVYTQHYQVHCDKGYMWTTVDKLTIIK